MLREIVVPKTENYNLHIPKEYVNQEVEILVLPLSKSNKTFEDLTDKTAGLLSKHSIDPVKWQEEIRSEWDEREELLDRLQHNHLSPKQ